MKKYRWIIILVALAYSAYQWYQTQHAAQANKEVVSQEAQSLQETSASSDKRITPSTPTDKSSDKAAEVSESTDRRLIEPSFVQKGTPEQLLRRMAYSTSYNAETRTPNWVGWVLTAAHTDGEFERNGHGFDEDTEVPEPRALYSDIRESECGYQRGHICPSGDNKWSRRAQKEAFLMTNICPQNGNLNQKDWKYLEEACRDWAKRFGQVHIVAGPLFKRKPYRTVGEHRVAVPDAFFKVVLAYDGGTPHAIGFVYDNVSGHHPMKYYARSVDEVERLAGLDFFAPLADEVEERVERTYDLTGFNRGRF